MIVDDSALMRSTLRRILTSNANDFCECSDGDEALVTYARYRPDWVLMDIRMEHIDGFEAVEQILSAFPEAQIIMVTQFDEPALKERAHHAGAVGYVLKENLGDLEAMLRKGRN